MADYVVCSNIVHERVGMAKVYTFPGGWGMVGYGVAQQTFVSTISQRNQCIAHSVTVFLRQWSWWWLRMTTTTASMMIMWWCCCAVHTARGRKHCRHQYTWHRGGVCVYVCFCVSTVRAAGLSSGALILFYCFAWFSERNFGFRYCPVVHMHMLPTRSRSLALSLRGRQERTSALCTPATIQTASQ